MIAYNEITTVTERKITYPDRYVVLPRLTNAPFPSKEHEQWVQENWWMVDYSVFMDNKPEAEELAKQLQQAFSENSAHADIPKILDRLRVLRVRDVDKMTPLEYWTRSAYQLANYCGDREVFEVIRTRLEGYTGEILEVMCGHTSYFLESPKQKVTALDYCKLSLERYPFPERRRIECDINQVHDGGKLDFFKDEQFDAVSICFGIKYPKYINELVCEFKRILRPSGILSFIENPHHGYTHLYHREFIQKDVRSILSQSGFKSVRIDPIEIPTWNYADRGTFYHVQARA